MPAKGGYMRAVIYTLLVCVLGVGILRFIVQQ